MSLSELTRTLQQIFSNPRPTVGLVFNPEVWLEITASRNHPSQGRLMYNLITGERRYFVAPQALESSSQAN